jgi:molecular chaperone GrpE (heat shock protein)
MRRSYQRRSAEQRVSALEQRIAALKAKQAAREKKSDPIVREMQKLQKRLKRFVQLAHDHKRPDVANSAMGFKSMLERLLGTEVGKARQDLDGADGA